METSAMKYFFLICSMMICSPAHAQIITYNLNRKLEYKLDDEHRTAILYNNQEVAPVLLVSYAHTWEEDFFKFANWQYRFNGKVYDLQGRVKNDQYFVLGAYSEAYSEFNVLTDTPGYKLSKKEYYLGNYDPCSMYEQQYEGGGKLRVFVYDMQDNEDYNLPMQQLLQSLGIPVLKLQKGQIIVYAELYSDESNSYPVIGQLQPGIYYSGKFVINQEDIRASLSDGDPEVYKKLHDVRPHPVYCEVIGWNNALDNTTSELLNEFFGDMCHYFELYGHNETDVDFNRFYVNEANRLSEHYRKHKLLSVIQADLFLKEAMSHRTSNRKENWIE